MLVLKYVQSFFNIEREHTIYLTSTGNLDIIPNNNPCRFINHLAAPITLDPNYDYEIGLVSILYPNEYYAIVGNQYKNKLTFFTKFHEISKIQKYSYTLKNSILAGDIEKLIYSINTEVKLRLMVYYDIRYAKVFGRGDIFYWDKYKHSVGMYYTPIPQSTEVKRKGDIENVMMSMGEGVANVLVFHSNTLYTIHGDDHEMVGNISSTPINEKLGVYYMYLYTDIIQPSNFGNQLVNILDCFTLDNGGNKGIHNTLYKPLKNSYIDQISIIISDQNGRKINFKEDSTLTCVLHIRHK